MNPIMQVSLSYQSKTLYSIEALQSMTKEERDEAIYTGHNTEAWEANALASAITLFHYEERRVDIMEIILIFNLSFQPSNIPTSNFQLLFEIIWNEHLISNYLSGDDV